MTPVPEEIPYIRRGTAAFRRTNLAFVCAGFATFALLYCAQPLLPAFASAFQISPAASSLALSVPTAVMAFCMLVASAVSEALGRKPVMVASVVVSSLLTVAAAFAPGWESFLVLRALFGVALSGLPAVAMAFISEEVEPQSSGFAMGLYISGTAIGGLSGRVLAGVLQDWGGWDWAIGGIGTLGVLSALVFWRSLPDSRHFRPRPLSWSGLATNFAMHLRDAGLRWLFLEGFLFMGSFVTVYNYMGFRLLAPPFSLAHSTVAMVFGVYVLGIGSSTFIGGLADRFGRRRMLWATVLIMLAGLLLTLPASLPLIILGMALLTFGFFGCHSLASSWVGRRALAAKAQASSLYLFAYYMGASVVGVLGGVAWAAGRWAGVGALVGGCLVLAFAVAALFLARLPPVSREG